MRFVIVSALAAVLSVAAIAPAISQGAGQPAATRAYMVEPFTPAAPITITATGVRLRAEPFTGNTPVLSSGTTGMQLTVVGISRQPDWNWYQVVLRNGQKAFIRSDLTSAPSRGSGQAATVAPVAPIAPTAPTPPQVVYTPTPPPTPPAYVPPAYTAPIPIDPQAVPLTPSVSPPLSNTGRPSLDLPSPSDPPGLRSN